MPHQPVPSVSRYRSLVESLVLLLYSVLLLLTVPRHESWGDEKKAWILAESNSLGQLATTVLRQEGTPGLWHGLLWLLSRLHLTFAGGHWLGAAAAVAGVFVLLRFSPFPLWLKALLPFTFYLVYQYAVVARQYTFFPLLTFALTALLCARRLRPIWIAVVAGLLGNVSVHGLCYAVGAMAVAWYLRKRLPSADIAFPPMQTPGARTLRQTFVFAGALLVCLWVLAIAVAAPLSGLHAAANLHYGGPAGARNSALSVPPATSADTPWKYVPPAEMNGLQTRLWQATHPPASVSHPPAAGRLLYLFIAALSVITFPISASNTLAVLFLAVLVLRLSQIRALVLLLPYLLLLAVMLATQVFEHHSGMLFIALLATIWMSFCLKPVTHAATDTRVSHALLTLLLVIALEQVGWGLHATWMDIRQPYTGEDEMARFLEPIYRHKHIIQGSFGIDSDPPFYAHHYTEPPPKLPGLEGLPAEQAELIMLRAQLLSRPDMILEGEVLTGTSSQHNQWTPMRRVGTSEVLLSSENLIRASGYRETHRFCGENFMRFGYSRMLCESIYEPVTPRSP